MPRSCTVCQHPQRGEIDAALVRGVSPYEIEAGYTGLKKSSVQRHSEMHLPAKLLKAQEVREVSDADGLKAELEGMKADIHRYRESAEEGGDIGLALRAVDRALKAMELQAKVSQIISDAPQVNIHLNPQWLEIRTVILRALEPHQSALSDVLRALEGVDDDRA